MGTGDSDKQRWLEKLCEKYGEDFCWPPYPRELILPYFITAEWRDKIAYGRHIRILPMETNPRRASIGDSFNSIITPKKRKKGFKAREKHHRVLQLSPYSKMRGIIAYQNSIFGKKTISKGEIMKDRVHRIEIVSVDYKRKLYQCVALAEIFNKYNLLENLIHCNYEFAGHRIKV